MQPAAARVGPSSEPSVRRIAVRFSSGATIFIEKTIKVWILSVASTVDKRACVLSSWQEARQHLMRLNSIWKSSSKQRDKNQAGERAAPLDIGHPPRSRRNSETSELFWMSRAEVGCSQNVLHHCSTEHFFPNEFRDTRWPGSCDVKICRSVDWFEIQKEGHI